MKKSLNSLVILFVFVGVSLNAQRIFTWMDNDYNNHIQRKINSLDADLHTSVRPYFFPEVNPYVKIDSLITDLQDSNRIYLLPTSWWARAIMWTEDKIFDEDFIKVDTGGLAFRLNPIVGFEYRLQAATNERLWNNTRGYDLDGKIGEKIYFNSQFYETQALLMPQVREYAAKNFVVPGSGRYKLFKGTAGADYAFANGSVAYKPNDVFTVYLGHGKHFLGDGYRSLLLSDNAFNYPYFKLETNIWKIKYVNLYGQLTHIGFQNAGDRLFDQKYFTAHYLSYNVFKRLNISLFEAISWLPSAERGVDWQYLNPIIFFRPVEWQNGSADNVIMGASIKFKASDKITLYGQTVIDDLNVQEIKAQSGWWANKYGFQVGAKASDLLVDGLYLQAEYNTARPYVYTHFDSVNAYTQLNQPLAHPLGANFKEAIGIISYQYRRHNFRIKYVWAEFGADQNGFNYGGNIFYSYNTNRFSHGDQYAAYGHYTGQGLKNRLAIMDIKYSYTVNPASNLMFEIGLMDRQKFEDPNQTNTRFGYIGLRTALLNLYNDFL